MIAELIGAACATAVMVATVKVVALYREAIKWRDRAMRSEAELAELRGEAAPPLDLPYRTSARPDDDVVERFKQPPLILEWSGRLYNSKDKKHEGTGFQCPRCERAWWLSERWCPGCALCETGHFHLSCGGKMHEDQNQAGCGATWIMRSKDVTQTNQQSQGDVTGAKVIALPRPGSGRDGIG